MTIIAAALAGAAFGTLFCFVYAHGTAIVDSEKMELAIGIATAVGGGAMFATTYVATWLMRLFNTDKITPTYIVLIIAAAIVTVVEIVNTTIKKKQESRF